MQLKTILTYAGIGLVLWWGVQQPANAAHLIHNIASFLAVVAHGAWHLATRI
jgi:hypothetical protein